MGGGGSGSSLVVSRKVEWEQLVQGSRVGLAGELNWWGGGCRAEGLGQGNLTAIQDNLLFNEFKFCSIFSLKIA